MPVAINGLTNPFENSILNSNLTQLEKEKQIANYSSAISQGYEPPPEVLAEIAAILEADVLSPEAELRLQALTDLITAEIGPLITSFDGADSASITVDENTTIITTITAEDRYSLNDGTETLTYSIVGGADMALFRIDDDGNLTFFAPPDYEAPVGGDNIYDVVVQVNDGAVLLDTQTLQVTVADLNDTAPVITSAAAVAVDENTTAVMPVTSDDPDTVGSAIYSIAGGADADAFSINGSTGELSFEYAPDFEVPGDVGGDNVYDVTVQVSDGIQTDTQDIAVTVADVNEVPPLPATFGVVLNGIDAQDRSGLSVSSAGDVNGDGIDDILIGAYVADPNGSVSGETYVVFGKDTAASGGFAASIDLASLDGSTGFVLNGIDGGDFSGFSVSSAGDVNGDGIDDILIGAFAADPNNASAAGETYVVFGKDTAASGAFDASIDLASLDGSTGFVLNGIDAGDQSGTSVSSAGDVNGDGIDDILIGANLADPNGSVSGETYVVFGKDTAASGGFAASIDLASLDGSTGFVLNGSDSFDVSGRSVSSAGDVNGDGIDDILIGASLADPNNASAAGETYVVFGKDTAASGAFDASIDLASLDGSTGFVLNGSDAGDQSGFSVSSAGDVNGDGIDDILIGASAADPNGSFSGETYVVFGKDTAASGAFDASIDLASLDGSTGFVLNGSDAQDQSGISVSSAGDVNGDGIDDILIGAFAADPNGVSEAGETYVVFGKDTAASGAFDASIDLASLDGSDGFVFNGIDSTDLSGRSVSAAGDVNGDGTDDILIGALLGDPNGVSDAGETYVVFGGATLLAAYDAADGVADGSINLSLLGADPMDFV